ncbi:MAG: hypothetical protein DRN13_01110 [Thermoplasmata archaeon]|nr:MAG: hypothetical protein DRN13_01110 [Thermoplasmata archaeon]
MAILRSKGKLDISYVPSKVLCRDREIQTLKTLVESGGKALISGEVGTGKTLLARYTFKDAILVNCFVNRSEHAILERILSVSRPGFNPSGLPSRKLWDQIPDDIMIILDEVEGISIDDLNHFLYTLSRRSESGRKLRYVAITRDANILRQMIGDNAIWSTFAEKAVVHLRPYRHEEMVEILRYRAEEALYEGTFDDEIISLIADISLNSEGHMRTGIDILRNSAILAEKEGRDIIEPEDVRSANLDIWLGGLERMDRDLLLVLLSMARASRKKAYLRMEEIEKIYEMECELRGIERIDLLLGLSRLEEEGYVSKRGEKYALLIPSKVLIEEIEGLIERSDLF